MKISYTTLLATLVLSGCGTFSDKSNEVDGGKVTAISEQRLSTNFRKEGVKIDWTITGKLKAIEVTGYAPSNGNTEFQQDAAFDAAELDAKAKLTRFLHEGISSSRVSNTISRNIEKARDVTRNKIKGGDDAVTMSDTEAAQTKPAEDNQNIATRDNTNDTTRNLIKKISEESRGILSGVYVKDTDIMGDGRTVKVVIRWDRDSQNAVKELRKVFN
jgi:hypothetical protein